MRYFLALARSGSVRAAGSALSVSHSTVLRRVEALESQLSVRLFDRHRGGYQLTEAGRHMVPRAERIEREMCSLERDLIGQDERLAGLVRMTCCDSYVSGLILEELAPFCAKHPEIELAISVDSRSFDLSKREADIAIRFLGEGGSPPEQLMGSKVAPIMVANYVAGAHAERLNPETHPTNARWLAFFDRNISEMLREGSSYPHLPLWGAFASLEAIVPATQQGLGLATLITYAADRSPGLMRLDKADVRHVADIWVLCHPDLRENARIRAVRQEVAAALRRNEDLFAGRSVVAPEGCAIEPQT